MSISATPVLGGKVCFIKTRDGSFVVQVTAVKDHFIQCIFMKNQAVEGSRNGTYAPTQRIVLFPIQQITYIEVFEKNQDIPSIPTNY